MRSAASRAAARQRRELERDVAAAHEDDAQRQLLEVHEAIGVEQQLLARDSQGAWDRSSGDGDRAGLQPLAVDQQRVGAGEPGFGMQRRPGVSEPRLRALRHAAHELTLATDEVSPDDARLALEAVTRASPCARLTAPDAARRTFLGSQPRWAQVPP
jgi:hypothetical protein